MTKQEALRYFRENILPYMDASDRPVVRQAWNDWTDSLQHDGKITMRQYETWVGPRERKTQDEYVLQGNYGYGQGWEDLTAEKTSADIRQRFKEYRENEGGDYRIVKRRIRSGSRDPRGRQRDQSKSRREPGPARRQAGCPGGTQVQSVILSQQFFSLREAEDWILSHGFRVSKIDESRNFWRFRQQPPTWFKKGTFRTIRLRPGVEAIVGCPL